MSSPLDRYRSMKDFGRIYSTEGAYHQQATGFKAWFLADNYVAIAAQARPEDEVLDLGCGEGCLGELLKVRRLVGVDNSEQALELNRELYPDVYHQLLRGDLRALDTLPLERPGFDLVACSLTLMYVATPDLPRCLQEVQRLLRPGGRFVFSYPTVSQYRAANPTADELPADELRWQLQQAGFSEVSMQPLAPLLPPELVRQANNPRRTEEAHRAYQQARKSMSLERCYHWLGQARKSCP
jgi:SAM-dependent methyltransferase